MSIKECYEILGVSKRNTDEEIRHAYREKAKMCHPDICKTSKSVDEFAAISEAYDTIIKYRNKKRSTMNKIIEIFPMSALKSKQEEKPTEKRDDMDVVVSHRGSDVYTTLEISFDEAVLGCRKEIQSQREEKCQCVNEGYNPKDCNICKGKGKITRKVIYEINVPRGVFSGQILKIKGKGNESEDGGGYGDLIINVQVQPKKGFVRVGQDIMYRMHITFPEAVLGTVQKVPTVYGWENCEIPAGTRSGTQLCLSGKGVIDEETGEVGNQYVTINIEIPRIIRTEGTESLLRSVQEKLYDENELFTK